MTDAEIVKAVLDGDHRAFTTLVRRYQHLIYGLAYHHTHNFEDARDAAQETFIRAFRHLRQLQQPDRFAAWLKQLAVNECRMQRRTRMTKPEEPLLESDEARPAGGDLAGEAITRLAMQQAMSALTEDNRLALTLFYFQSYSLEEIAGFLEVPTSTVMSRLRNARRQLKREWLQMTEDVLTQNRLPEDWAERVPIPYDEYDQTGLPEALPTPLSPFRAALILSAFPGGSAIVRTDDDGSETGGVFKPVRAQVRTGPEGTEREVILKMQSKREGVEVEALVLTELTRLGLPVPELLAGPTADPDYPGHGLTSVIGVLPGADVLSLCWSAPHEEQERWMEALFVAIERLHALTPSLEQAPALSKLERNTLGAELQGVVKRGGPWMKDSTFAAAVTRLQPLLAAIDTPLAFSNGIYAPNAFLSSDGHNITGYNNFTFACFEDPHIGFVKYLTYDWYPLNRAGVVERWLTRKGLTRQDFAPRLALRCLTTLQREVSVRGKDSADYRKMLLDYLKEAFTWLE